MRISPFRVRRWVVPAAALAAAALLVVAVRLTLWNHPSGSADAGSAAPELQALIDATAQEPSRFVVGRLSGGFKYGRPPSPLRGPVERAVSPDIRIAANTILQAAARRDSPAIRRARAAASLALGDIDRAVDALEAEVRRDPTDGRSQTDLSAAYLARASARGANADWQKALDAAERGVKSAPGEPEAYFNRALAFEGLHRDESALTAWAEFEAVERTPAWRAESAQHVRQLRGRPQGRLITDSPDARSPVGE